MANVKPFISLLVATSVFSYRITNYPQIFVTLLFITICITLLSQIGLLIEKLASSTDISNMSMIVGSYSWYYSDKVNKKENKDENNEKDIFWTEVLEKDFGQETSNPHIIARRHITSGNKTDVVVLNKILPSKFDRVLPEELKELISIEPKTVQYCEPDTKQVNKKDIWELIGKRNNMLVFMFGLIC
jgi:hypothetical protein